jgi:hypothetical protein
MDRGPDEQPTSAQLLERMFAVERRFLRSDSGTAGLLATAFHPDVVIHEPEALPYGGDWRGLEGVAALFRAMRETWSDIRAEDMRSARDGDTVFMACTLHLTSRATGRSTTQPFAERRCCDRGVGSRGRFHPPRHVAAAGEEAGDGDVFVEVFPVEAKMADLDFFAIRRAGVEETREPRERHADRAPVCEFHPHRRVVKANRRRRNGHARPSTMPLCSRARPSRYASVPLS